MNEFITALLDCGFPPEHIHPNEPMARHTTFRVGGPADYWLVLPTQEAAQAALRCARETAAPITIVGNGSNLLVRDGGIRGMVLHPEYSEIRLEGKTLIAEGGASIASCARLAQQKGLEGMAEISGIPGSIAGGALMNAGAYGREIGELVTRVDVLRLSNGETRSLKKEELNFGYRTSTLLEEPALILRVCLALEDGDPEEIAEHMNRLTAERRAKQPLELPSAGSTFKRPEGAFAARLIDECGLKGLQIGGAQVSTKHAGFIVNTGDATAADILDLMERVQKTVEEKTGFLLEPEIRILGED